MRNKSIISVLVLALVLALSGVANATVFSSTYTADNFVTNFTLSGGGDSWTLGAKTGSSWRDPLTTSMDVALKPNTVYTASWTVVNIPTNVSDQHYSGSTPLANGTPRSAGNPTAFLGLFSVQGHTYYSNANDGVWQVNGLIPAAQTSGANTNIWLNNGLKTPGVYESAAWLGVNADGSGPSQFVVTAKFTSANTPVPAAVWLLGSGLAGLAGLRRKFAQG